MSYALGLTNPPTQLSSFSTPIPQPFPTLYLPYTRVIGQNGAGVPVTMGPPTLEWRWEWMLQAWFNEILALLGAAPSVPIYVSTLLEDGTFGVFRAVMWRPTATNLIGSRRGTVVVKFTSLDSAPTFVSGVVEDAAENTVVVTFSKSITASDYTDGVVIKVNTVAATISSAARQTDHSHVNYVLSADVANGDVVTFEYTKAGGDYASEPLGTEMEDVAASAITNNVV